MRTVSSDPSISGRYMIENKPRGGRETATGLLASTEVSQYLAVLGGMIHGQLICTLYCESAWTEFVPMNP